MAIIRLKDLRGMSSEELTEKMRELRIELSREKGASASGTKPENPGKIKEMKKTIARILTILNQRKKKEVLKKK